MALDFSKPGLDIIASNQHSSTREMKGHYNTRGYIPNTEAVGRVSNLAWMVYLAELESKNYNPLHVGHTEIKSHA